ncbi:MAG: hypothetical protein MUD08_04820 [Cytophagales bacterium]|nr:hypothetical protein [Cytophagales bacterium]
MVLTYKTQISAIGCGIGEVIAGKLGRNLAACVLDKNRPKRLFLNPVLAQASACAETQTSVRWSQTDRFAKADVNRSRRQQHAFWAKIAQNVSHIAPKRGFVLCEPLARDQRTLV